MWHAVLGRQRILPAVRGLFFIFLLLLVIVAALVLEVNGALVFMGLSVLVMPGSAGGSSDSRR